ncbi:MAG: hypothetical protein ACM3ZU_08255 [Bacteroidota bacterium]
MIMRLCRCRLLVCLSLAVALCAASSLRVGAASGPFDTAMEFVATNDWDTALYALDMASRESVELGEMLRAALWKAVILRSLIEGDFVMYGMLYDGAYAATGSDKDSFQRNRKEVFNLTSTHMERLMPVIEELTAKEHRQTVAISTTRPCRFPPSDLEQFKRMVKLGLYPGDQAVNRELQAGQAYSLPSILSQWTGMSTEDILKGMIAGDLACEVDMVAVFLDLGKLAYPKNDAEAAVLTAREKECGKACLEKVIELTETEPYCKERLEALKLLGR